ncbi:hypothetical protein, partial [Ideonella livida]
MTSSRWRAALLLLLMLALPWQAWSSGWRQAVWHQGALNPAALERGPHEPLQASPHDGPHDAHRTAPPPCHAATAGSADVPAASPADAPQDAAHHGGACQQCTACQVGLALPALSLPLPGAGAQHPPA